MTTLLDIQTSFPELESLIPLAVPRSGQKDVLRGRIASSNLDVVLKLVKPSPQDAERTIRELEAVARLSSPYVPCVYAHGVRGIGHEERIFMVEQFIDGSTYRAHLRASRPNLEFVLGLGRSLLRACCDFETANLVHRDIKPDNILIDIQSKVWVIDFGLVRLLDAPSLTATEQHFGPFTPGYGAPEQIRNKKAEINIRADLFSVGVVLYESLAGSNPYLAGKGDILQVIRAITGSDLPRLPSVDPELADFIQSLTARFPSRRPQSAKEAAEWYEPIFARLCG